jgi:hypothetical protein
MRGNRRDISSSRTTGRKPNQMKQPHSQKTQQNRMTTQDPVTTKQTGNSAPTNKRRNSKSPDAEHTPQPKTICIKPNSSKTSNDHNMSYDTDERESVHSQDPGVISDACSIISSTQIPSHQPETLQEQPGQVPETQTPAPLTPQETTAAFRNPTGRVNVDLTSQKLLGNLPETARTLHMQTTNNDGSRSQNTINLIILGRCIKSICGDIHSVEYIRSGGIFITCNTKEQVQTLINTTHLTPTSSAPIPVTVRLALTKNTVCGKIFAPELADIPHSDILEELSSAGVVSLRKFYGEKSQSHHVPLFVLSFLGSTLPSKVKIGYSSCRVEKYYPSPLRCSKCLRFRHSALSCKSKPTCSHCSKTDHSADNCPDLNEKEKAKCINCHQAHSSYHKTCPIYLREKEICRRSATENLSYTEARRTAPHQHPKLRPRLALNHPATPRHGPQICSTPGI